MSTSAGFFREAWLIVAEGGWWTPREIFERVHYDIDIDEAHALLWAMARRHRYLVRRGAPRRPSYAVTPACVVPRGIVVADLVRAVGVSAPQPGERS